MYGIMESYNHSVVKVINGYLPHRPPIYTIHIYDELNADINTFLLLVNSK